VVPGTGIGLGLNRYADGMVVMITHLEIFWTPISIEFLGLSFLTEKVNLYWNIYIFFLLCKCKKTIPLVNGKMASSFLTLQFAVLSVKPTCIM
jgi:hypothetical protein